MDDYLSQLLPLVLAEKDEEVQKVLFDCTEVELKRVIGACHVLIILARDTLKNGGAGQE